MIYTVIALKCLGYEPRLGPMVRWALRQLDDLLIEEDDTVRVQPCVSPVWDTAIATIALADAELPAYHPALLRAGPLAARARRSASPATGSVRRPGVEPTRLALPVPQRALPRHRRHGDGPARPAADRRWPTSPRSAAATRRGRQLAARDAEPRRRLGGLRRRHRQRGPDQGPVRRPQRDARPELRRHHGAGPRDRSAPSAIAPTTRRSPAALDYLWRTQEPEGCWYGRWGVNYIYGTWQVLQGLQGDRLPDGPPARPSGRPTGSNRSSRPTAAGARPAASYDDPSLMGQGEPTASQTAWAVLGLIAAGRADGEAVRRGHRVPARHPAARRHLGRGRLHRHRLPARLLPEVSSLPDLLPADGPRALPGRGRRGVAGRRRPAPWPAAIPALPRPVRRLTEPSTADDRLDRLDSRLIHDARPRIGPRDIVLTGGSRPCGSRCR